MDTVADTGFVPPCLRSIQLVVPPVVSSTTRVISSAFRAEETSSSKFASRTLAVAGAAAALGGGMAAWTLCEQQQHLKDDVKNYGVQRTITKQGLTDPMTAYQNFLIAF